MQHEGKQHGRRRGRPRGGGRYGWRMSLNLPVEVGERIEALARRCREPLPDVVRQAVAAGLKVVERRAKEKGGEP